MVERYKMLPEIRVDDPRYGYISIDQLFTSLLDQYLLQVIEEKELDVLWWFFQGSRYSGKTYAVLTFFMKCFLATAGKGQHIFYIVRRTEKQLNKMKKQIFEDFRNEFSYIVENGKNFKGGDINQLKFKDNYICFETINDDKIKLEDGGATGGTTWNNAKYIFIFFEECSQLNRGLVDQITDTIRGGSQTQKVVFYASNPWHEMHWYTRMMFKYLPENRELMERQGYQYIQTEFSDKSQAIFLRNNLLTNPYIPIAQVRKIQAYREYNLNAYNICFLGLCGVLEATLYTGSLKDMKPIDWDFIYSDIGTFHVGIDWGEGKSKFASPTTMHLGKVHNVYGCQVIREYTHWNNGNDAEGTAPAALSTNEQFDKMITQLIEWYNTYKKPLVCFIDNGATIDFASMFNNRLKHTFGISPNQITAYQADKSVPIEERVLTTNILMSKGLYRIDKEYCPQLWIALQSCRQMESDKPREDGKFMRDHIFSHWINSGAEYILDSYAYSLSEEWSEIYETRKD